MLLAHDFVFMLTIYFVYKEKILILNNITGIVCDMINSRSLRLHWNLFIHSYWFLVTYYKVIVVKFKHTSPKDYK